MRLALIVEYEGTNYQGFQYQANAPSIQEELEKSIVRLTGESLRIKGAGRTDAGVHSKGQIVAFDTAATHSCDTFLRALNSYLPDEIAVTAAYRVRDGFDPRRDALSRRYRFTILNSQTPRPLMRKTTCRVGEPLKARKMHNSAKLLEGRHDFVNFSGPLANGRSSTERHIYEATVKRSGDVVTFEVEGSSFLPHQVRRMAGSLVDIGRDRLSIDEFKLIIDGAPGLPATRSLSPQGLCLMQVTYADFPPNGGEQHGDEH